MKKRVICAIDHDEIAYAVDLAQKINKEVAAIKLGLQFFCKYGIEGVKKIEEFAPIFLDLKLHDIPNTVGRAVSVLQDLKLRMLTVHALGGHKMLKTAQEEFYKSQDPDSLLLAVTMLTSMSEEELEMVGIRNSMEQQVMKLAEVAYRAEIKGLVCSPWESNMIKKHFGNHFTIVTPGIRLKSGKQHDQSRIMTPSQAIKGGADYLVIGRPITECLNASDTLIEINREITTIL